MRSRPIYHSRGGFLLAELLIGLVIVALVVFGAAMIMEAVAQGWNDQEVTRSTQVQANQTYLRIQNALEDALYIGYATPSSFTNGSIFYWANNDLGGVQAGDPYAGEMALIQYDPTTSTLWLYYVPQSELSNSLAQQPLPLTLSDIDEASEASWFTEQSFVTKQALGGPGESGSSNDNLNVSSFQVYINSLNSTTQLPLIEYSIGFTRSDGTTLTLYNTTTVRGPTTQPS
jgi:hypothetical protein